MQRSWKPLFKQKVTSFTVLSSTNSIKTLQTELTLNPASCQLCEERQIDSYYLVKRCTLKKEQNGNSFLK